MERSRERDTYRLSRLDKPLNVPDWIDVIWLLFKFLQNKKYLLYTLWISDQIGIVKFRRQKPHTVGQPTQKPMEKTFIEN